jgi:putative transposase
MTDDRTPDLFATESDRPGSMGCAVEIAATMAEAIERARSSRGMTREMVAERMSYHLGKRVSEHMLNAYTSQSHDKHEISLRRAMAFDAAVGEDHLLALCCSKRGGRSVVAPVDAALLEWARLHHQERALAERRKALEAALKARGRQMSRTHYSCAELAAIKLPGLPGTENGWKKVVARESWPAQRRAGRGGGMEYRPPAHVAAMILVTQTAPVPATAPAASTAPVVRAAAVVMAPQDPGSLTDKQRLERDARMGVLAAIRRLQDQAGCSQEAAITTLLVGARAGKLDEHVDRMLRLARDPRGRAGDGYPSERSLKRWLSAVDLAPRQKQKDLTVPAWVHAFMAAYQQPQKPSIQQAYRQAYGMEPLGQARGGVPSIHQVRRFLDKVGAVSVEAGRMLPREIKAIKPFIRRRTDHMWPDDCYTADGHTFDAEVAHPRHGKAFRPEITTVLSVSTRRCVGWSLGLAESTWGVLDAQRHAVEQCGIPALWYFDRGPGFDNLMQTDELTGFVSRLGGAITHSLPYNSQARGLEERSHRTFLVAAAKKLPTYMGAAMDREARQRVHKITRADIRVAGTSRLLMSFDAFKEFLAAEIDAYNHRPHRALPKFVDEHGVKRHMSPVEAWEAARAEGWEPTLLTDGERDDLFRPYATAKVLRGEIRLFNNLYFSADLEEHHGETVRVGYDIHDASRVWVRDIEGGRLICVAHFEANHRAYFPQSVIDQAAQRRAEAREKRLQAHITEVREELEGRALLQHQAADLVPVEAFTAIRQRQEAEAIQAESATVLPLETADRRPLFDTDPEKYRWLIAHPDHWDADDAGWLMEYVAGEDYGWMRERYEAFGQAWNEHLAHQAESLRHKEAAAR